nr:hypothetical protein CFP56_68642 [Quercus suber]
MRSLAKVTGTSAGRADSPQSQCLCWQCEFQRSCDSRMMKKVGRGAERDPRYEFRCKLLYVKREYKVCSGKTWVSASARDIILNTRRLVAASSADIKSIFVVIRDILSMTSPPLLIQYRASRATVFTRDIHWMTCTGSAIGPIGLQKS